MPAHTTPTACLRRERRSPEGSSDGNQAGKFLCPQMVLPRAVLQGLSDIAVVHGISPLLGMVHSERAVKGSCRTQANENIAWGMHPLFVFYGQKDHPGKYCRCLKFRKAKISFREVGYLLAAHSFTCFMYSVREGYISVYRRNALSSDGQPLAANTCTDPVVANTFHMRVNVFPIDVSEHLSGVSWPSLLCATRSSVAGGGALSSLQGLRCLRHHVVHLRRAMMAHYGGLSMLSTRTA